MYYTNIANSELQYFKNLLVNNFTIKLSDVLTTEKLFKVEEIIANSIYKIYPMFYTQTITSSNSNDRILDNRCIICQKQEDKETYLTFISDENSDIHDFQSFAEYFDISDNLSTNQYNHIVSLLRHNTIHNDTFKIIEEHQGNYAKYTFNVDNCTITDAGIVVDDDTRQAEPKVKLESNVFHYSTYTLQLSILHYSSVNILDDSTEDYVVVDTMELELPPNQEVTIPLDDLEDGYIISLNVNVKITHDKPIIPDWIQSIDITAEPSIIQTGENAEIYATGLDNGGLPVGEGHTIHFFEKLEPSLTVSAVPQIIQTGEDMEIYSKVKDSDGSLAKDITVYFYQVEEEPVPVPSTLTVVSDKDILSYNDGDKAVLTATVLDGSDVPMEGQSVVFKLDGSVLDTVVTDSSGIAEYEYSSQGVGDVTFTVECMNLQETYELEDCINYDPLTSNSGKWTIPSGVTSEYGSNGWKITANAYKQVKLTDKLTNPCSVEFTIADYSNTAYMGVIIYAYTNGETTPNQLILMGGTTNSSNRKVFDTLLDHDFIKGGKYRIEYTSNTIKVYENDVLLGQAQSSVGLPTRFEFHTSDGRWATYKDLKVKPL